MDAESMDLLSVSLWLHLLAVAVWVGGVCSWMIVLLTRETSSSPTAADSWLETIGRRIHTAGWEALGLIVLTGLFNLIARVRTGSFFQNSYQRTLGLKLALVAGMVGIQLWQHFGLLPRLAAETEEEGRDKWRRHLLVTSGAVVVLAAGALWFGVQLHHG